MVVGARDGTSKQPVLSDMEEVESLFNASHEIRSKINQENNGRNGTFIFLTEGIFLVKIKQILC